MLEACTVRYITIKLDLPHEYELKSSSWWQHVKQCTFSAGCAKELEILVPLPVIDPSCNIQMRLGIEDC